MGWMTGCCRVSDGTGWSGVIGSVMGWMTRCQCTETKRDSKLDVQHLHLPEDTFCLTVGAPTVIWGHSSLRYTLRVAGTLSYQETTNTTPPPPPSPAKPQRLQLLVMHNSNIWFQIASSHWSMNVMIHNYVNVILYVPASLRDVQTTLFSDQQALLQAWGDNISSVGDSSLQSDSCVFQRRYY